MTYTASVEQVSYQDPDYGIEGSDKYYAAYVLSDESINDHRVLYRWGRRGAQGQSQVQVCHSRHEAELVADRKIQQKRAKGYGNNLPTDGTRELDRVSWDVLERAGVNAESMPTPVSTEDRAAVFADFGAQVDRLMRMSMGTPEEQQGALVERSTLKSQLDTLREGVLRAEGAFELLDDVLYSRMEAV